MSRRTPTRSFEDTLAWLRGITLPVKARGGKTDRLLKSTRLDSSIYADLRDGDDALDAVELTASEKLRSFPALSQDIFQSFYSLSQQKTPEEQLTTEAREINARLLENVTGQDDYPTLKNVCEGRELLAYEAAGEFISRTADRLDSLLGDIAGEKGPVNTLKKLEAAAEDAAERLAALAAQAQAGPEPDEAGKKEFAAAAARYEAKQRQADAVRKIMNDAMLQKKEEVEQAVSSAVTAAKDRAQEAKVILTAWSDDPAEFGRTPINEAILEQVRQNQALRDISRYLGRFREIFAQGRKNGYTYSRGETYSLELGNDIGRALTSELSMLASPQTVPLFLRKYQQKRIKQYRRREPAFKGMGDMICCLDESGSMEGGPIVWGKAVAMTLLEIAAEGKRKFALIRFSGSQSVQTDLFLPGEYTWEDKLRACEGFLGGGTDYEAPLTEALWLMESGGFENADVVFLTDGECSLPEDFSEMLREEQVRKNFTVTGILLDEGQDLAFSLSPFCRRVYRMSQLDGEEIVRSLVNDIA